MFVAYDLKDFGVKLKKIRKKLGYSQADVKSLAGINEDTIRRIEIGSNIPRYDTLEILSVLFKEDLLEILKDCRSNQFLMDYHDSLDLAISNNDIKQLTQLQSNFEKNYESLSKHRFISKPELEQFDLLLKAISLYNSNSIADIVNAEILLLNALRLTIPSFNFSSFEEHKYTYVEHRILLLLSLILGEKDEYTLSNQVLSFILNQLLNQNRKTKYTQLLITKIYCNLAYNYHMIDRHEEVIKAASEGIAYCLKQDTIKTLHVLYYRKGIAEYLLKNSNYIDSLQSSVFLLKLTKRNNLLDQYIKITKEKYDISLK